MHPNLLSLTCVLLLACGGKSVDIGDNSQRAGWLPSDSDATADAEAGAPQPRTLYDGGGFIRAIAVDETTLAVVIQDNVQSENNTIRTEICQLSDCRNTLQTINTDSNLQQIQTYPSSPYTFNVPASAITISNGEVIWFGEGGILACSTQGCPEGPRTIYHGNAVGPLAADADFVYSLHSPDSGNLQVARYPRSGCTIPDTLELSDPALAALDTYFLDGGQETAMHIALSQPNGTIYFSAAKGIVSAPLDFSAEPAVFYQAPGIPLDGLAVVGSDVYFAVSTMAGQIRSCAAEGCGTGPKSVVSDQRWPNELVADTESVYWVHDLPANVINSQLLCPTCTVEARAPAAIAEVPIGTPAPATPVVDEIDFYSSCPLTINSHYLFWCAQRELTSFASTLRMQQR